MSVNRWIAIAALLALTAVGLGALGAHAMKDLFSTDQLASYQVAVQYQMFHALGLLGVAWWIAHSRSRLASAAAWFMFVGVVMFSGSIYALVFTAKAWLGPITPIGGLLMMIGWLLLAVSALRPRAIQTDATP